jgi:putative cardiolipin synthase
MDEAKRAGGARSARTWLAVLAVGVASAVALRRLSRLPEPLSAAPLSPAIAPSESGVGRHLAGAAAQHAGQSGLHLLADAHDAFAARMLLAAKAESTLDLQYYIWHGDRTGTLLLEAAHRAAERGVRVRLLLDDNGISGLDTVLAALDRHPNVEVRLFNPFRIRFPKAIGFLLDFERLNRRMHNKSFTVDGAVTIIGGRNVGDEYFGGRDGGLFADLDVMAVGDVVRDVQRDFERYWTSRSCYPASQILRPVPVTKLRKLERRSALVERDPSARTFVERMRSLPLVEQLLAGTLALEWCAVRLVSDDPAKALGQAGTGLLAGQLEQAIGEPTRTLGIVAGYFVPGEQGTRQLCDLAARGVAISVLTNAFAANDVAMVHAGYARYRKRLLRAGVRLFELCGDAAAAGKAERRRGVRLGIGSSLRGSGTGSVAAARSRASTLHAKTFTVDRTRLFIGSFNFDPRSIELNTELGFVIESPALASRVADTFDDTIPDHAFEVTLDAAGDLQWRERSGDTITVHEREPAMGIAAHAMIAVAQRLPIERLL